MAIHSRIAIQNEALVMSEQTSILHAFRRTDLKARVKVTTPVRAG